MIADSPDSKLVSDYAAEGSEAAFRALVSRHVDMVFATALRQTGSATLAEEVTQSVFLSLARKAVRLAGFQTLGGWLFRTAVLESKARIRSELRRRRREEAASQILALQREGTSPSAALLPLLDEALLSLREVDRLALVLRFLEERSFREVGLALGTNEEAARKRVFRALERVGGFFRQRGFVIPSAGGASALLASTVQAAPPALAVSAANAALSAGGAASGIHTILFQLVKLTKTQITAVCVVLAAVPLVWQHFVQTAAARQRTAIETQIAESARRASALEAAAAKVEGAAEQARAEAASAQLQSDTIAVQLTNPAARPRYHWDNDSPYARVSKQVLSRQHPWAVATDRGQVSEDIKKLLQMTEPETSQAQGAVDRFLAAYESLEASVMKRSPATARELERHPANEVRALDVPYVGSNQMIPLRQALFAQVTTILGGDRAGVFTNGLSPWMPLTDDSNASAHPEGVYCSDLRVVFYQPKPGDKSIFASFEAHGPQCFHRDTELGPGDVPPLYVPYVQDWMAAIQNPPP